MSAQTKCRKKNRLINLSVAIFCSSLSIISFNNYFQMTAEIDFVQEVHQAVTVDAARNALVRGEPWLTEHLPNTAKLRIWQSNLNYLREQPALSLLPPQIKASIDSNANSVEYSRATGWWWIYVGSGCFSIAAGAFWSWLDE